MRIYRSFISNITLNLTFVFLYNFVHTVEYRIDLFFFVPISWSNLILTQVLCHILHLVRGLSLALYLNPCREEVSLSLSKQ